MNINLDPADRPETCAETPKTDAERLFIVEHLLFQHGLEVKDVTREENQDKSFRWFALVKGSA